MKPSFLLFLFALHFSFLPAGQTQSTDTSNFLGNLSLEAAGFNRDSINKLMNDIGSSSRNDFRSVVILKDNQIVLEEYFNTFWAKTIHDIRSAGKSVTALLLGAALEDGLIDNLDQSVYSLFSEKKNPSINEDYKKIKLRHLLDMSSGLDADTDDLETAGHAVHWVGADDWKSFLLNVPLKNHPGENWAYADIHALLIGLAIEEAAGMSLKDYAQQKLFGPMDFEPVYWYTNPANQTGAAGNLYITGLDFAKLGLLLTNQGQWNGQQIISKDYIAELMSRKKYSAAVSEWFFASDHYGMLWYKSSRTFGGKDFDYVFASGSGGNHLIVIPKENMVIALTSSAYGPGHGQGRSYYILN